MRARAQGGHHYEVKNVRFWPWTMQLCVKLNLAGFNLDKEGDELPDGEVREYAAHLKLASRTLAHMHYGDDNVPGTKRGSLVSKNHQQQCVQLSVGDLDHVQCESGQAHVNKFMPWDMVPDAVGLPGMLSSIMLLEGEARRVRQGIKVPLVERLCYAKHWPHVDEGEGEEHEGEDGGGGEGGALGAGAGGLSLERYEFDTIDHKCNYRMGGSEEDAPWTEIANFEFLEYKAVYDFPGVIPTMAPIHLLVVRWKNPKREDGPTLYLKSDRNKSKTSDLYKDCSLVSVEVEIDHTLIQNNQQLIAAFQAAWSKLMVRNMTIDMLHNIMAQMPEPPIVEALVKFGRQPHKQNGGGGYYVCGNCAIKDGVTHTHADANIKVIPALFPKMDMSFTAKEFPQIVLIPFPHVRFMIWARLWNNIMPRVFLHNELAAKAVLAFGVLGVHSQQWWAGGSGVGHSCPLCFAFSTEAGTGKTEALSLVAALMGRHGQAMFSGGSSMPALNDRLSAQADLPECIDDYVAPKGGFDKTWAQFLRQVFDKVQRSNKRGARTAESTLLVSTNGMPNQSDAPFLSRLLQVQFKPRRIDNGMDDDNNALSDLYELKKLLSACLQDVDTLLWHGKIDKEAILDCATFMQQTCGTSRDRNMNLWGALLYYMLLLTVVAQNGPEKLQEVVRWVIQCATEASHIAKQDSNELNRFIVALSQVMPGGDFPCSPLTDKPEQCVFWHNFRTNQKRSNGPHGDADPKRYYAICLGPVCAAIRHHRNIEFNEKQISKQITESSVGHAEDVRLRRTFVDVSTQNWPIATGTMSERTPLLENEVTEAICADKKRCVLIDAAHFDKVCAEYGTTARVTDYTKIMIGPWNAAKNSSANREVTQPYNFFSEVTSEYVGEDAHFIFRALTQCTWAPFCGGSNFLNMSEMDIDEEVEHKNIDVGFGTVMDCYKTESLLGHFNTRDYLPLKDLPPAITALPFTTRDAYNDGDEPVPDPCEHHPEFMARADSRYSHGDTSDEDDRFCPGDKFSPRSQSLSPASMRGSDCSDTPLGSPTAFEEEMPEPTEHKCKRKRAITMQSDEEECSPPYPETRGSSLSPLSDISNGQKEPGGHNAGLMSGGDRAVLRAKSVMARNDITGAPSSGGSVAMYYEEPDDEEPWRDPEDDEVSPWPH